MYFLRDERGLDANYEAIAVIEHQGSMTRDQEGQGHFICDVKHTGSDIWYRTNDNHNPTPVSCNNVTKKAIVILYKRSIKD